MQFSTRKPTMAFNLDLGRSDGPRAVALDAVSWWHVRQRIFEAAAFAFTFSLIGMAFAAAAQKVAGH